MCNHSLLYRASVKIALEMLRVLRDKVPSRGCHHKTEVQCRGQREGYEQALY